MARIGNNTLLLDPVNQGLRDRWNRDTAFTNTVANSAQNMFKGADQMVSGYKKWQDEQELNGIRGRWNSGDMREEDAYRAKELGDSSMLDRLQNSYNKALQQSQAAENKRQFDEQKAFQQSQAAENKRQFDEQMAFQRGEKEAEARKAEKEKLEQARLRGIQTRYNEIMAQIKVEASKKNPNKKKLEKLAAQAASDEFTDVYDGRDLEYILRSNAKAADQVQKRSKQAAHNARTSESIKNMKD